MTPQGIFNLDYINTVWNLMMPPDKRKPVFLSWGAALMAGMQWNNDALFGNYMLGSTDTPFNPTVTYSTGNRVLYCLQSYSAGYTGTHAYYGDNAVYEALTSVPLNTPPTGTNIVPDTAPASVVDSVSALNWLQTGNNGNPFYWVKVQDNFIGANERTNYSCQQLTMEVALNRWFNITSFANYQWDHTGSPPFTQIYIDTNQLILGYYYCFPSNPDGSQQNNQSYCFTRWQNDQYWCFPSALALPSRYDFTVYVPVNVYNALCLPSLDPGGTVTAPNTTTFKNNIISALLNKFNAAGMLYNIKTY